MQRCYAPPWCSLQLTVRLVLADGDVSQIEPPPVQYCRVSRQSYLHTLIPEALSLLHSALPPGERSPWFDYNSLPLKWCALPPPAVPPVCVVHTNPDKPACTAVRTGTSPPA